MSYDVRITAIRKADYKDLQAQYENPIQHACDVVEGQTWTSHGGRQPEDLCDSAWQSMAEFVEQLAAGGGNFYLPAGEFPVGAGVSVVAISATRAPSR